MHPGKRGLGPGKHDPKVWAWANTKLGRTLYALMLLGIVALYWYVMIFGDRDTTFWDWFWLFVVTTIVLATYILQLHDKITRK